MSVVPGLLRPAGTVRMMQEETIHPGERGRWGAQGRGPKASSPPAGDAAFPWAALALMARGC